ncbi:MAG: metallophosphoesterase [Bacteroidota bacterium]
MRFLLIQLFLNYLTQITYAQLATPQSDQDFSGPTPYTGLDFSVPDGQFQFVIVTDRTGGLRPGIFSEAVDKINLLQPQFTMSVGDLITGYTEDTTELHRQWDEFDAMVNRLDAPFFYVPGNHDITNQVMEDLYKQRYGPTYYSFVFQDVLFLCLNSEDQRRGAGSGTISDQQYAWIAETLANHQDVKWTLVFLHQPLWDQANPERWPDVERLLSQREHTVYSGHVHHYQRFTRNNGRYYTLATTGGGSRLRGPRLGEFDQISWVTMTDDGPIMANLALDGIYSDSVTTKADYDFIRSFAENRPVRFDLMANPNFYSADSQVRFQLHNPTDFPMHARIEPQFSFDYLAALPIDTLTVAPNSVDEYSFQLRTREETIMPNAFLPLHIYLSFDKGEELLTIPFAFNIAPVERFDLAYAESLSIDNVDWSDLRYQFGQSEDPTETDFQVAWNVKQAEESLIFWAEVKDDAVLTRQGEAGFKQDYLGVVVNADPLPMSMLDEGERWYENSLVFLACPVPLEEPPITFYTDRYDFTIPHYCHPVEGGYRFAAELPLSYVEDRLGRNWQQLRINVSVQDEDPGQEEKPRFYWQPNWRGDTNLVGSGLFFRN